MGYYMVTRVVAYLCDADHILREPPHLEPCSDAVDRVCTIDNPPAECFETFANPCAAHVAISFLSVSEGVLDARCRRV